MSKEDNKNFEYEHETDESGIKIYSISIDSLEFLCLKQIKTNSKKIIERKGSWRQRPYLWDAKQKNIYKSTPGVLVALPIVVTIGTPRKETTYNISRIVSERLIHK